MEAGDIGSAGMGAMSRLEMEGKIFTAIIKGGGCDERVKDIAEDQRRRVGCFRFFALFLKCGERKDFLKNATRPTGQESCWSPEIQGDIQFVNII